MVEVLDKKTLEKIQKKSKAPAVSIYLPMQSGFAHAEENRILFKNALRTAWTMLGDDTVAAKAKVIKKLKNNAHKVGQDRGFWESQSMGLVVFLSPDNVYVYRMNHHFEKRIFVGITFISAPLHSILSNGEEDEFYVLTLSQKATRLFKVFGDKTVRIESSKIPPSLKDALRLDEMDRELQTHMVGLGGSKGSEGFHGHGYYKDRRKNLVDKYLRLIESSVKKILNKSNVPLFVVGTTTLTKKYMKLNSYRQLVNSNIHLNADHLSGKQITKLLYES